MSSTAPDVTGLVLAGGGARGAYELGALRVLLPALEADGFPVRVLVGTSVGALNVAWLGANADVPAADRVDAGIALWQRFRFDDVVAPVVSKRSATTLLSYLSRAVFGRGARPAALLDPAPLTHTVDDLLDFAAVRRNVADGVVDAVAVAATSVHTGRTVVFHAGGAEPERDRARGIEYAATDLGADHVLASAAIPALFPSRQVDHPARAAGQYVDGGTRLNTPIKPALKLGATRIVVVGLNALWQGPDEPVAGQQPNDVFDGLAQILQALLAEPLAQDVQTLARRNELPTGEPAIPYVFV